jgi:hypothetical protein
MEQLQRKSEQESLSMATIVFTTSRGLRLVMNGTCGLWAWRAAMFFVCIAALSFMLNHLAQEPLIRIKANVQAPLDQTEMELRSMVASCERERETLGKGQDDVKNSHTELKFGVKRGSGFLSPGELEVKYGNFYGSIVESMDKRAVWSRDLLWNLMKLKDETCATGASEIEKKWHRDIWPNVPLPSGFCIPSTTPYGWRKWNMLGPVGPTCKNLLSFATNTDEEKRLCDLGQLRADDCVVVSVGSQNRMVFEANLLRHTNCSVHVFDCVTPLVDIPRELAARVHSHRICLGPVVCFCDFFFFGLVAACRTRRRAHSQSFCRGSQS